MGKTIGIKCPKCGHGVVDTYICIKATVEWKDGGLQSGMSIDAERVLMSGTKASCPKCQFSGWIENFEVKDDECRFRDKECPKGE